MKQKLLLIALFIINFSNAQLTQHAEITLSKPKSLVFNGTGDIFILDDYYTKVIKLNSSLVQSNVIADFSLSMPSNIAYNSFDNCIYVSGGGFGNGKISKITQAGVKTELTDPLVDQPVRGLVCDNLGNIYYNSNNNKIYKRTQAGVITEVASNVYGLNLAMDATGNLITNSNFNECIYSVNIATGVKTTIVNTPSFSVESIALDVNNNIYFSTANGSIIYKIISGSTNYTPYISGLVAGNRGLAVNNNYLYVADYNNRKIFKSNNVLKSETFETVNFSVFPNPANSSISLKSDNEIEKVAIYDINGKLIKTQTENFETINIENFSNGIYLININDMSSSVKLIKE